jgi:very-short-patch-repair endonuclease
MKIKILESATQDLLQGYRFYKQQEKGLGGYFLDFNRFGSETA